MRDDDGIITIPPPSTTSDTARRLRHDQFAREFHTDSTLKINSLVASIPTTIVILGVGGIGAWAGLYFGRIRNVEKIVLIDPDCIEDSNLNRTPFGIEDVGDLKVNAVSVLISRNNPLVTIFPINRYFDDILVAELKEVESLREVWQKKTRKNILVVDCRDNYFDDYHFFDTLDESMNTETQIIRVAYNGGSITIDFEPKDRPVMGRGGYDTQPSHVFPAALSGLLAVSCIMNYFQYKNDPDRKYLIENPLTFESTNILEYLFNGLYLHRLACGGDEDCSKALTKITSGKYYEIAPEDSVFVPFRNGPAEEEAGKDSGGTKPKITQIPVHPDELGSSGIRQIRI